MIALDKQGHIAVGAVIGVVTTLAALLFVSPLFAFCIGYLVTVSAGIGKEMYDSMHPDVHTEDIWDALATSAGGAVGALAASLAFTLSALLT